MSDTSKASTTSVEKTPVELTPAGSLSWLLRDAPEYEERKKRPKFVPPTVAIKDVHAAVPKHLFERNTAKGLFYVGRHVALSALFYVFATRIDGLAWRAATALGWGPSGRSALVWAGWILYWFWQSVSFSGMWTLGTLGTMPGVVRVTDFSLDRARGANLPMFSPSQQADHMYT